MAYNPRWTHLRKITCKLLVCWFLTVSVSSQSSVLSADFVMRESSVPAESLFYVLFFFACMVSWVWDANGASGVPSKRMVWVPLKLHVLTQIMWSYGPENRTL